MDKEVEEKIQELLELNKKYGEGVGMVEAADILAEKAKTLFMGGIDEDAVTLRDMSKQLLAKSESMWDEWRKTNKKRKEIWEFLDQYIVDKNHE